MDRVQRRIEELIQPIRDRIGVSIISVETGDEIGVNDCTAFPMASVSKVPILVTCMRMHDSMELDLNERLVFRKRDRALGTGLLSAFDDRVRLSIRDMLLMMICVSDNGATDRVLRRIGIERVNKEMQALGLTSIDVHRTIQGQIDAIYEQVDPRFGRCKFGEHEALVMKCPELRTKIHDSDCLRKSIAKALDKHDRATPRDLSKLLVMIAKNSCASEDSCAAMIDIMGRQCLNTRLPRFLPALTRIPHKTGTYGFGVVVNDIGILYKDEKPKFAISVLSTDLQSPIYETEEILGKISRALYDYMVES